MNSLKTAPLTLILLTLLLTLAGSCSPPPEPTTPQASRPSETTSEGAKRCGDGVCDGPEDAQNCPKNCGASSDLPTPVYVTVAGHI